MPAVDAQVVVMCIMTQMNYLNKALDLFNTAIVSPVYYVMFTVLTIVASIVLFQDIQTGIQLMSEMSGFVTIVAGTFLLHTTKDLDLTVSYLDQLSKIGDADSQGAGGMLPTSAVGLRERRSQGMPTAGLELARSTELGCVEDGAGEDSLLLANGRSSSRKMTMR